MCHSSDDDGQQLSELWNSFIAAKLGNQDSLNVRIYVYFVYLFVNHLNFLLFSCFVKDLFIEFAIKFVDIGRNNTVAGHPSALLLEVSHMLFSYVSVPNENASNSGRTQRTISAFEHSSNTISNVNVLGGIQLNYLWNTCDDASDGANPVHLERDRFLLLVDVFGILCTYTYNRDFLMQHFGGNVIEVYLALYGCLLNRLDAVVGDMINLDKGTTISWEIVNKEFEFLMAATMVGLKFVWSMSSMLELCSPMTQLGVVPVQPWGRDCLSRYFKFQKGYNSLAISAEVPVGSAEHDSAKSEIDTRNRLSSVASVGSINSKSCGNVDEASQNDVYLSYASGVCDPSELVVASVDVDPYAFGSTGFVTNSRPVSHSVRKSLPSASMLVAMIDLGISVCVKCNHIYEMLLPQIEINRVPGDDPCHGAAMVVHTLKDTLVVQTESILSILCCLCASSQLCEAESILNVLKPWANSGVELARGFEMLKPGAFPVEIEGIVYELVLQRGLLFMKANHVFALLISKAKSLIRKSSLNAENSGDEFVLEFLNLLTLKYDTIMFDAVLNLSRWLHEGGFGHDSSSALAETDRDWLSNISISCSGPASFNAANQGCDFWPWSQATPGDDSFTGASLDYRLCTFPSISIPSFEATCSKVAGGTPNSVSRGSNVPPSATRGVKPSYLYMKDTPLFIVAGKTNRLECNHFHLSEVGAGQKIADHITPAWLNKGSKGRAWEIFFAVAIGICFGDDYSAEGKVRHSFYEQEFSVSNLSTVFASIVHSIVSCLHDPSNFYASECPVLQYHFLIFLAKCFKQCPIEIVALCRQQNVLDLLLGDYFLQGGVRDLAYLFSSTFSCNKVDPATNRSAVIVDTSLDIHESRANNLLVAVSWIFLHDSALDFIRCTIGALGMVTKEQLSKCSIKTINIGVRKDIVVLLNSIQRARSSMLYMDSVIYQIVCLVSQTLADVMLDKDSDDICTRSLACCLELCYGQAEIIGIKSTYPHDPFHREFVNRVEMKRVFLWMSRVAALRLLLRLVASQRNDQIELFLDTPHSRHSSDERLEEERNHSSLSVTDSLSIIATGTVWSIPSAPSSPTASQKTVSASNGGSSKPRGYYQMVAALLYDPRCKDVAIYILTKVMLACSHEVQAQGAAANVPVDSYVTGVSRKSRASLRVLACDIIQCMLYFVGYASKHPEWCESYTTSYSILFSMTSMLRSRRYLNNRTCLQDFFRKGDSIAHVLDVLKNCTRVISVSGNGISRRSEYASIKLKILRQGLSLLTAIMNENAACKNEFKYVMTSSPSSSSSSGSRSASGSSSGSSADNRTGNGDSSRARSGSTSQRNAASLPASSSSLVSTKFRRYHNFKLMLLLAECNPSLETFLILVEMLLDSPCLNSRSFIEETGGDAANTRYGLFANNDERPKIMNYCVIPCIICLIPHCSQDLQICIVNTLHNLVVGRSSLVNLSLCTHSQPVMLGLIMDLFPFISDAVQEHAGKFLETLGQYSFSVAQLKHMFRLIHSKGDYRPGYTWRLLHALQGMVTIEHGPRHFFVFEGSNSGLKLPPIQKWPAPKGFTICFWFRVTPQLDMYDNDDAGRMTLHVIAGENIRKSTVYNPYLVCFRSSSGTQQGFEIFLKQLGKRSGKYQLNFQTIDENGNKHLLVPDAKKMTVTDGDWHFLAATVIISSSGFRTKSEIGVTLDHNYVKQPFQSPVFSEPIEEPLIGECITSAKGVDVNTTLRGQLGAIYLFNDSLSEVHMRGIRDLGPDYFYCFEPFSAQYNRSNNLSAQKQAGDPAMNILDGSLTNSVALTYNPAVWSGDYFLDSTPDKNTGIKWKAWPGCVTESGSSTMMPQPYPGKMHAKRILPGTYRSNTQNLRIALDSLGGLKAIFPLFAQFDQPRLVSRATDIMSQEDFKTDLSVETDDTLDGNLSITVLELLYTLLENSGENRRLLNKLSGLSLVAYFLERVSPLHLTSTALDIIIKLYDRLEWSPVGQNSILESFLCNFKLWVFTSFDIQSKLMQWLVNFSESRPQQMKEIVCVQKLLDDLYLLYGYEKPNIDSDSEGNTSTNVDTKNNSKSLNGTIYMNDGWVNEQTGEISGERLAPSMLKHIRGYMLHILYNLLTVDESPLPEETEAVVEYIIKCESSTAKIEGLRLLLRIMNKDNGSMSPARVLLGLACSHGLHAILPLHSHECAQVRIYACLLFCKVVNLSALYRLLPSVPNNSTYAAMLNPVGDSGGGVSSQGESLMAKSKTGHSVTHASVDMTNDHQGIRHYNVFETGSNAGAGSDEVPIVKFGDNAGLKRRLEMSSFDALGISVDNLTGVILWIQEQLAQTVTKDVKIVAMGRLRTRTPSAHSLRSRSVSGTNNDIDLLNVSHGRPIVAESESVLLQCKLILACLQLTMLGASSDHLANDCDALFSPFVVANAVLKENTSSRSSSVDSVGSESVAAPLKNLSSLPSEINNIISAGASKSLNQKVESNLRVDYAEINAMIYPKDDTSSGITSDKRVVTRNLSEGTICVPMIFPAILMFLRNDCVPPNLRLTVLVNLKLILSTNENCDRILRLPAWQDYFFNLISTETVRLNRLEAVFPEEDRDLKMISKAKGIIDTCIRIVCDISSTAVRIGRPVGAVEILRADNASLKKLDIMDYVQGLNSGDRLLGVSVLRENFACLRVYNENGKLNSGNLMFEMMRQVINQLQHDRESFQQEENGSNSRVAHSHSILYMNVWLVSAIFMEIFSMSDSFVGISGSVEKGGSVDVQSKSKSMLRALRNSFNSSDSKDTGYAPGFNSGLVWELVLVLKKLLSPLEGEGTSSFPSPSVSAKSFLTPSVDVADSSTNTTSISKSFYGTSRLTSDPTTAGGAMQIVNNNMGIMLTKTNIAHSSGVAYWLMVRVFCSALAMLEDDGESGDAPVKAISALTQLQLMMDMLEEFDTNVYEFESVVVVSRLVVMLRSTGAPEQCEWVEKALKYVEQLACENHDNIVLLLCAALKVTRDDSKSQLLNSVSAKLQLNYEQNAVVLDGVDCNSSIGSKLHTMLTKLLKLPNGLSFSWKVWDIVTLAIVNESKEFEGSSLALRFVEMGLHADIEEVKTLICSKKHTEAKVMRALGYSCASLQATLKGKQVNRMWDSMKVLDNASKKCNSRWASIIAELANERGPWGVGAEDHDSSGSFTGSNIFWTLDFSESNKRIRHKIIRNKYGTAHNNARLMQKGIYVSQNGAMVLSASGSEGAEEMESSAMPDALTETGGMWKDLNKYKGIKNADKDDGGGSDEEEAVENAETIAKSKPGETNSNVITSTIFNAIDSIQSNDRVLFSCPCIIITVASSSSGGTTRGTIAITRNKVIFTRSSDDENDGPYCFANRTGNNEFSWVGLKYPSTTWSMNEVRNIYQRHYQLRFVGIEMFFTSRSSVFMSLDEISYAKEFYQIICRKIKPPHMVLKNARKPKNAMAKSFLPGSSRTVTQAWVNREISNFDYLMHLNTTAGRSFNDLGQYPVFPWIIADYKSKKLDLRNPKTFRNLRYPMGAQLESARAMFTEKYADLQYNYECDMEMAAQGVDVDELPPYHYGSHYSCMGFVVWYLLRMEPFTSLHVWLQDGKFDKPDRLFDSIENAYTGCTTNQADVKELIPEFFCCPEIFENCNNVDFGKKQNGEQIDAVKLPPWAKNAHEFVKINRDALESDYVSRHLHHWIDLVFGYKQRPPHMGGSEAAVEACNVFFHLTYENAVDLEELKQKDVGLYEQTVRRIDNFGQTPICLFDKPHPERASFEKVDIIWPIASAVYGADTICKGTPVPEKPRGILCFKEYTVSANPVVFISELRVSEKLLTVDSSRILGYHLWQVRQPDVVPPYALKLDSHALKYSQGLGGSMSLSSFMQSSAPRDKRIGVPFATQVVLTTASSASITPFIQRTNADGVVETVSGKKLFEEEEAARYKKRLRAMGIGNSKTVNRSSTSSSTLSREKSVDLTASKSNRISTTVSSMTTTAQSSAAAGTSSSRQVRSDAYSSLQLFAASADGKLVFSCGHWDYSFKATTVDTCRLVQSVWHHRDVVSCLAVTSDFGDQHWLATGSRDYTVMVWELLSEKSETAPINPQPLHVLYGHDDVVTTVAINAELDIVVSGSDDGTIIIHTLRSGAYLRSIVAGSTNAHMSSHAIPGTNNKPLGTSSGPKSSSGSLQRSAGEVGTLAARKRVHWLGISKESLITIYTNDGYLLFSYTINGRLMAIREAGERLHAFCLSEDGKVILTGGDRGLIVFRWTRSLDLSNDGPRSGTEGVIDGSQPEENIEPFNSPIRSICLSHQERHLLVGLESGCLRVFAQVT